ncbi:DegT/DnrJ/EryC1/StrS aminotransferase family protein [Anaerotruncus sp. 1XD22-93]|nr:DegT/DnrJ/EryC1/StrS aminotransferase family protein [Lachnospiraceae bacterium]NBI74122.1 DegT/DnrJ/EryC1/StrS aminotransferase family protein [Lachnospiraceae bacterium]RKK00170.1 DegT/DnrJ/EryC1/StrS aminotransferase family protein [Anaerotruncus sp. 1XD22-93]
MQFRDLKAQYQALKPEIDQAVSQVIIDSNFISGKQVAELEKRLAEYVGVKHCISCANGTDALTLALMAWEIKEGDAVFVPDFTFFSTGEVVSFEGALPVFVDVDKETFNMSPDSLEQAIKRTLAQGKAVPKAVIAVDLFGQPADYGRIRAITDKYGLKLLEDGAQGFGGSLNGKRACSFGDISTTSFFPAKPLGCYGDGGAVFTDDDAVADLIRSIRIHGKGECKYDNVRIGMNSRLDTLQAAILQVKLDAFVGYELNDINKAAEEYTRQLKNVVMTPVVPEGFYSSWAQYTIQLRDRDEREGLQAYLKGQEIPSMIYYPKPMHEQGAFADVESDNRDFLSTAVLCDRVLALPLHPYMKQEDVKKVVDAIKEYLKSNR